MSPKKEYSLTQIAMARDKIRYGALEEALEICMNLFASESSFTDDLRQLNSRFSRLNKQVQLGLVSHGDSALTTNQISYALLCFLTEIRTKVFSNIEIFELIKSNFMISIANEYATKKSKVIEIFSLLKENLGGKVSHFDEEFNRIQNRKYTIAFIGKVKAGKSTLINALLGESLLPTDYLQNTSSIIEITKSQKEKLTISYADGSIVENEDSILSIKELLSSIAAIDDNFRKIPTTFINNILIEKGLGFNYDDSVIRTIVNNLPNNEFKLSEDIIFDLVKKYINENKNLNKIPITIHLEFPLNENFQEVCIVDTPGIDAIGGFQDTTFNYISNADSVIFVHPLTIAPEGKDYVNILEAILNKTGSKLPYFLILSQVGKVNEGDRERKSEIIRSINGSFFGKDKIIEIDSIYKMLYDDLNSHKFHTLDAFYNFYEANRKELLNANKKNDASFWEEKKVALDRIQSLERPFITDIDIAAEKALQLSNFYELSDRISHFSAEAPFLRLKEFLENIEVELVNDVENIKYEIGLIESMSHQNSPDDLLKIIKNEKETLNIQNRKAAKIFDMIEEKYLDEDAKWREKFDTIWEDFKDEIEDEDDFETLKDIMVDVEEKFQKLVTNTTKNIRKDIKNGLDGIENLTISLPKLNNHNISGVNIEEIKEVSVETTFESRGYLILDWFLGQRRVTMLNKPKFISSIKKEVKKYRDQHKKIIEKQIDKCYKVLKNETKDFLLTRGQSIQSIEDKFDDINFKIKKLDELKSISTFLNERIREIENEIKSYNFLLEY